MLGAMPFLFFISMSTSRSRRRPRVLRGNSHDLGRTDPVLRKHSRQPRCLVDGGSLDRRGGAVSSPIRNPLVHNGTFKHTFVLKTKAWEGEVSPWEGDFLHILKYKTQDLNESRLLLSIEGEQYFTWRFIKYSLRGYSFDLIIAY